MTRPGSPTRNDDAMTVEASNADFSDLGTVGVEEEFYLVDAAGHPRSGASRLLDGRLPEGLDGCLDTEVYDCLLETKTPVRDRADGVRREITALRRRLDGFVGRFGYGVAAAGLHPVLGPDDPDVTPKARYRAMVDRLRYPQRCNTTAGLHVHVGVDDADKAVWIANELRWYVPVFLALGANSPYYDGRDTGLASGRANIFGSLPNTGIPPTFDSYSDMRSFRETMAWTRSVPDTGQLWWDVRVKPDLGTVEIRAPDAQFDPDAVAALVEYARALVLDLAARYEDGESGSEHRIAILEENKWRALRYGHTAQFVDGEEGEQVSLGTVLARDADRLGVDGVLSLHSRPSGATRQRTAFQERGVRGVCDLLRLSPGETQRQDGTVNRAT